MKNMKKLFSLLMVVIMALTLALPVMAQDEAYSGEDGGEATITISNATKDVTYKVVKLFDASATGEEGGSIVYTGSIPEELKDYFTEDANGYISATSDAMDGNGDLGDDAIAAMKTWAEAASTQVVATAISNGSVLNFTGLPYGYYVVTTTPGGAITVTSTNPTATIFDKNPTGFDVTKSVEDKNVYIGQTAKYTVKATTANFLGEGKDAKQVVQYEISDNLPSFLSDVTVTGITIGGAPYTVGDEVPQFENVDSDEDKEIIIPWVDENDTSLYAIGSPIVITYEAKVTSSATIDGAGNENEVTLTPYVKDGGDDGDDPDPWDESKKDKATIYTYAAALQKVDEDKKPLAGAVFQAMGLNVTGSAGVYTVTAYNPDATTYGDEMKTDAEGQLVILGLPSDIELTVKESAAPAGYNILADIIPMTPVETGKEITATSTTIYYDADGKVTDSVTETSYEKTTYNVELLKTAVVVVNEKGTELPSTGGMGTTIFYVLGGVLIVAAGVLLITKKRMNADK